MPLKPQLNRGMQYSASHRLTVAIEQTGSLELTFRAGTFLWRDRGRLVQEIVLATDEVAMIEPHPTAYTSYTFSLVENDGRVEVWQDLIRSDEDKEHLDREGAAEALGVTVYCPLIGEGWLVVPPGTTDLSELRIPHMVFVPIQERFTDLTDIGDGSWRRVIGEHELCNVPIAPEQVREEGFTGHLERAMTLEGMDVPGTWHYEETARTLHVRPRGSARSNLNARGVSVDFGRVL